jgi:hypothetical protein
VETSALILGGKSIEAGPLLDVDPFFIAWRKQFVALAARSATLAIYPIRWFAEVGGLMS